MIQLDQLLGKLETEASEEVRRLMASDGTTAGELEEISIQLEKGAAKDGDPAYWLALAALHSHDDCDDGSSKARVRALLSGLSLVQAVGSDDEQTRDRILTFYFSCTFKFIEKLVRDCRSRRVAEIAKELFVVMLEALRAIPDSETTLGCRASLYSALIRTVHYIITEGPTAVESQESKELIELFRARLEPEGGPSIWEPHVRHFISDEDEVNLAMLLSTLYEEVFSADGLKLSSTSPVLRIVIHEAVAVFTKGTEDLVNKLEGWDAIGARVACHELLTLFLQIPQNKNNDTLVHFVRANNMQQLFISVEEIKTCSSQFPKTVHTWKGELVIPSRMNVVRTVVEDFASCLRSFTTKESRKHEFDFDEKKILEMFKDGEKTGNRSRIYRWASSVGCRSTFILRTSMYLPPAGFRRLLLESQQTHISFIRCCHSLKGEIEIRSFEPVALQLQNSCKTAQEVTQILFTLEARMREVAKQQRA